MDNQTDYYLLLVDIEHSTSKPAGEAQILTDSLLGIVETWNSKLKGDLVSPLELNYGDEIAGLFCSPKRLYDLIEGMRHGLKALAKFRFVVVKGRIGAVAPSARQMGGPVFKTANKQLNQLKKSREFARWCVGDDLKDELLTSMCLASNAFLEDMTAYQYQVHVLRVEGHKQKDIAVRLGKYGQSVSDAIKRSHSELVIRLDCSIKAVLHSF